MPYHDMYLALSPEAQTAFYMVVCYGLGQYQCRLDQFSNWLNNPVSGSSVSIRKDLCRFVLYDLRPLLKSVEQQLLKSSYEDTWDWLSESPGLNEEAAIEVLLQWLDSQTQLIAHFGGELEGDYEVEGEDAPEDSYQENSTLESLAYEVVNEDTVEIAPTPEPARNTPNDPRLAYAWNHSKEHRDWLQRCDELFQSRNIQAPLSFHDALTSGKKTEELQALIDMGVDNMSFGEHSSITWVRGLLYAVAGQWVDAEQCLRRLSFQQSDHPDLLAPDRLMVLLGSKNWSSASGFLQDLERKRPADSFTPNPEQSCRRLIGFNLFGLSIRAQRSFNEESNVFWPLAIDPDSHSRGLKSLQKFSGAGFARFLDAGTKKGRPYLVFESQGGSVLSESLVSVSSLFMSDVPAKLGKLANALHRFHEAGCVHGAIHRGSLEQVGYGSDLQWTCPCPGLNYHEILKDFNDENPGSLAQSIAPELRNGSTKHATIESDYFSFGHTVLDLLKECGEKSGPFIESLKRCIDAEPSTRREGFQALLGQGKDSSVLGNTGRSVVNVSVKLGPPKSSKKLNEALTTLLGILENPRNRDEACLLAGTKKAVDDALKVVKANGSKDLYKRLADRVPSESVLKVRRKMTFIPEGEIKNSAGKVVKVPGFLIEKQGRFNLRPKLGEARTTLQSQGLDFPTFRQWQRILDLRPAEFTLPKNRQEWLREKERRGRHLLGRAIAFHSARKDPWTWPYQTYWLPSHRPGTEITARGVIDLRGS